MPWQMSAATAKIDGIFFVLDAFFGIFLFGETVEFFDVFWNSSYIGRVTLDQWLGIPIGWVVLGVVFIALFMFWGAEQLERIFGGRELSQEPKLRFMGAGALIGLATIVLAIGQPTVAERWEQIAPTNEAALQERAVHLQAGEVLHIMHDHKLKLVILDVRKEADYNQFHLAEALHKPIDSIPTIASDLQLEPPNTVFLLSSNDEAAATEAWKALTAQSVPNVYILEGGINEWLRLFACDDTRIQPIEGDVPEDDVAFTFEAALGVAYHCAEPDSNHIELEYEERFKLELKRSPTGGGCG